MTDVSLEDQEDLIAFAELSTRVIRSRVPSLPLIRLLDLLTNEKFSIPGAPPTFSDAEVSRILRQVGVRNVETGPLGAFHYCLLEGAGAVGLTGSLLARAENPKRAWITALQELLVRGVRWHEASLRR